MVEHGDGGALSACDPIRRDAAGRPQPLEFVGPVPFKPLEELQRADFLAVCATRALGQVEIVRQGIPYVTDGGSFTLTAGVVGREPRFPQVRGCFQLAEDAGFEPARACTQHAFQACAIGL